MSKYNLKQCIPPDAKPIRATRFDPGVPMDGNIDRQMDGMRDDLWDYAQEELERQIKERCFSVDTPIMGVALKLDVYVLTPDELAQALRDARTLGKLQAMEGIGAEGEI